MLRMIIIYSYCRNFLIIIIIIIIIFSLGLVKKQLQKRAVKTLMGLGQHFRKMDQSGDGVLDRQELLRALHTYHIQIPEEVHKLYKSVTLLLLIFSGNSSMRTLERQSVLS